MSDVKTGKTQWNVQNVPTELDIEIKTFLLSTTPKLKLYEFVLEAVQKHLEKLKTKS